MKTRTVFLILGLAWLSLACLSTAPVAKVLPVMTATATGGVAPAAQAAGMAVMAAPSTTETTLQCVTTSATEAQNLRSGAGVGYQVSGALYPGEVWEAVNIAGAEWWQVRRAGLVGWARREWLKKVRCEDDK